MNSFAELVSSSYSLTDFSALVIKGPDCEAFLQAQTTNDLSTLLDESFQLNTLLDVGGRLESYFLLLKKDSQHFILLTPAPLAQQTMARLEKFHISEELSLYAEELAFNIHFFSDQIEGFKGNFGNLPCLLCQSKQLKSPLPTELHHLAAFPVLHETVVMGEIINNSLLAPFALNLKKGCFPGQEPVGKIASRRGAAVAPVLLESESEIKSKPPFEIKSFGQKLGKIKAGFKLDKYYYLAFLSRENQISNKELRLQFEDQEYNVTTRDIRYLDLDFLVNRLYYAAVSNFQKGLEDAAIKQLESVIRTDPKFEDAYEALGVIYGRQEKFQQAIVVMERLAEVNPHSVMAQTNLSMFQMKIGNIDQAEKHKAQATLNQFQQLGDEAEKKRKLEEADQRRQAEQERREEMFKKVLEIDAVDPLANQGLAELRLEQKDFLAAIGFSSKAIEGDKKYSVAYLVKAKALLELGSSEEAKEVLESGIKIAAKNGDLMPANEMQGLLKNC